MTIDDWTLLWEFVEETSTRKWRNLWNKRLIRDNLLFCGLYEATQQLNIEGINRLEDACKGYAEFCCRLTPTTVNWQKFCRSLKEFERKLKFPNIIQAIPENIRKCMASENFESKIDQADKAIIIKILQSHISDRSFIKEIYLQDSDIQLPDSVQSMIVRNYTDWLEIEIQIYNYLILQSIFPSGVFRNSNLEKWHIIQSLLWCAKQAATGIENYLTDKQAMASQIKDSVPWFVEPEWAWGCVRTFLEHWNQRTTVTPVALWDESSSKGMVAGLYFEVLEKGSGAVFHHPKDAMLSLNIGNSFLDGIRNAWLAAHGEPDAAHRYDGRWSIDIYPMPRTHDPMAPSKFPHPGIMGTSAGGAAGIGWTHALKKTWPDPGIIAISGINEDGLLGPVLQEGIVPKLQAVLDLNAKIDKTDVAQKIDTVALVKENYDGLDATQFPISFAVLH